MKKIFAITCHKLTTPFLYTVNYLSSFDENKILIHVDAKSDIQEFSIVKKKKNIIFLSDRKNITWGSVSQIKATLLLMEKALEMDFDYFFLLSGDDIPVRTNNSLDEFLYRYKNFNFVDFQSNGKKYIDPNIRVMYKYPKIFFDKKRSIFNMLSKIFFKLTKNLLFNNKYYLENKKKLPTLYKGSNWFGITYEMVIYIKNYLYCNPFYIKVFEHSLCGDEVFFHSIIKTNLSPCLFFSECAFNCSLQYVDWETGPHYPRILDKSDIENIKKSRMFFARKFNNNEDISLLSSFIE